MTEGYSNKPLIDKLGLKIGMNATIVNAPEHYDALVGEWPVDTSISWELNEPSFDFIHYFATDRAQLEADAQLLAGSTAKHGLIWISWPKLTSGVKTDVTEQSLRDILLPTGLVDVKVAAIDETWSGMKFVWRKEQQ